MLIKRVIYKDWEIAQEDMKKANDVGFDTYMMYSPHEKGWSVTFRTLRTN